MGIPVGAEGEYAFFGIIHGKSAVGPAFFPDFPVKEQGPEQLGNHGQARRVPVGDGNGFK